MEQQDKEYILLDEQINNESHQYDCPICLNKVTENEKYMTECSHIFCIKCIECLIEFSRKTLINCPLCRKEQYCSIDKKTKIPFDLQNYPENPEIEEKMVLSAYNTISQLQKWEILYNYEVDKQRGFMLNKNKEIDILMNEINKGYNYNHTGCSMGCTMRELYYIAHYGVNRYIQVKKNISTNVSS
jgi:hypothetical protein